MIINNKDKIFSIVIFLVSVLSGWYLFFYQNTMDDSWIKSDNYLESYSFDSFIENVKYAYDLSWQKQGRFPGVIPFIRAVDGAISFETSYHYIFNVLFHGANSVLLFFLMKGPLQLERRFSFISAVAFSLVVSIRGPLYAIGIYIGSFYVNLLTVFLLLLLSSGRNSLISKLIVCVFFVLALGNYSLIVMLPAYFIFQLIIGSNFKSSIIRTLLLSIPILINVFIIKFSPDTSYIGTRPNFSFEHIVSNLSEIISRLIPFSKTIDLVFLAIIFLFSLFSTIKNRKLFLNFLFSFSLLFSYIIVFALTSRFEFPNPYFLYIPYFGFILTCALLIYEIKYPKTIFLIFAITFNLFGYRESTPYRQFRVEQADKISTLKNIARRTFDMNAKFNIKNSFNIILVDEDLLHGLHLGYHDRALHSWKDKDDSNLYVFSSDYKYKGKTSEFKVGYSQYTDEYLQYRSIDQVLYFYFNNYIHFKHKNISLFNVKENNIHIFNAFDAANIKVLPLEKLQYLDKIHINSMYKKESNKERDFYWANSKLTIEITNAKNISHTNMKVSGNLFSIVDNDISISSGSNLEIGDIHLDKQSITRFCFTYDLRENDDLDVIFSLEGKNTTQVAGDPRNLSFFIDANVKVEYSDLNKPISCKLQ
ncbi:hypothetical protein [Vibrio sp. MA40-2]|uniref:hypothetical protein n=1 Tax=Vibrio sp. MA40-2 TaxID=3391828 RepID=UPI0039A5A5AF